MTRRRSRLPFRLFGGDVQRGRQGPGSNSQSCLIYIRKNTSELQDQIKGGHGILYRDYRIPVLGSTNNIDRSSYMKMCVCMHRYQYTYIILYILCSYIYIYIYYAYVYEYMYIHIHRDMPQRGNHTMGL